MDLFQWLTDTTEGKCLFTTLVSMIPIIELRGGIPFGVALGLPYWLAFPAAGTGAWTGSLVAAFLNMRLKQALPAVVLGVMTAGCIMTALTHVGINLFA